jgi:transcriptional regulator with XRE-family HTH domain
MLKMKAERLRRGWTQTDLGARTDLSASDVSRIETGRLQPYPRQAQRIAKALKLAEDELLTPVDAVA